MLEAGAEERLLRRAVALGVLREEDVPAGPQPTEPADSGATQDSSWRFGPRLDHLLRLGKLAEGDIHRLAAESTALDQTVDGTFPPSGRDSGSAQSGGDGATEAEVLPLAHTLQSDVLGGTGRPVVSVITFPAPHWDRYEFLSVLGRGGMGAVYRARDRRLGRTVALKFILSGDEGTAQRFMQEARAQSRLDHPCICRVFEVGVIDQKPYIALELIEGTTLDRANLTLEEKVRVFRDAADAIHYAHEQGIIHRDIKPSNIMVQRRPEGGWRPVIMDFGLARETGGEQGLTESGAVMGTPAYMSPEQARGDAKRLDRRSDVYSLGATLYDVLAGTPPFSDETVVKVLLKVMDEPPPLLRTKKPELPEALELVVSKCMNKEPEQRYATARDLAEDLGRYLAAQRITARRLSYRYRLAYWARRNKALATVAAALLLTVLGGVGLGIRGRVIALRKERIARQEAVLAERLGQSVKDLEWLIHAAHQMPLHDTRHEKDLVRERMAEITAELAAAGDSGGRLGAYALGRGHLALHEWEPARRMLEQAASLGYSHPELDYALGRVLGELYSRALEDARRSGDKSFVEKRKEELRAQYLEPALAHLRESRGQRTISASYVEGLLDYYQQRYDAALLNAHMARQKMPWLYEAAKLEGDVHLTRALEQRDRGEPDQADRSFALAIDRYGRAAELAPSDYRNHEALAEAWTRWEEMDFQRGRDSTPRFREALAAAERALEADPAESRGHVKKAFAYYFQARYAQIHGDVQRAIELFTAQASAAEQGAAAYPEDAYAFEINGLAYHNLAACNAFRKRPYQHYFDNAYRSFERAIKINPRFPWALNDYALALGKAAFVRVERNEDPGSLFLRALGLAEQAIQIDPNYLYAYNTAIVVLMNESSWGLEHGVDPGRLIRVSDGIVAAALRISDKFIYMHINIGLLFLTISKTLIRQGRDASTPIQKSIEAFLTSIKINGNIPDPFEYLAHAHQLKAEAELAAGRDALPALEEAARAIAGCYKIAPEDPFCQSGEAQLRALRAATLKRAGRPFLDELLRAHRLAQKAAAAEPESVDGQLLLAAICRQRALDPPARGGGQEVPALLSEGLGAVERVLSAAPGLPGALAFRGALLLIQAKREKDAVRKSETLRAAVDSFTAAFAGNPSLRKKHAEEAEEAQRLAKGEQGRAR